MALSQGIGLGGATVVGIYEKFNQREPTRKFSDPAKLDNLEAIATMK